MCTTHNIGPPHFVSLSIFHQTPPNIMFIINLVMIVIFASEAGSMSIPWNQRGSNSPAISGAWYFQGNYSKKSSSSANSGPGRGYFASDSLPNSNLCEEPMNLPQQFMEWFRESTSDPTMLTVIGSNSKKPSGSFDALINEPDSCTKTPSTEPDADMMDRALCPWQWKLNRDENREPKLISEARCLCRRSRGAVAADCVPIEREFPVLRRVKCDESGSYQYRRSHQTITVGCHSVMPRMSRAASIQWLLKSNTDV